MFGGGHSFGNPLPAIDNCRSDSAMWRVVVVAARKTLTSRPAIRQNGAGSICRQAMKIYRKVESVASGGTVRLRHLGHAVQFDGHACDGKFVQERQ